MQRSPGILIHSCDSRWNCNRVSACWVQNLFLAQNFKHEEFGMKFKPRADMVWLLVPAWHPRSEFSSSRVLFMLGRCAIFDELSLALMSLVCMLSRCTRYKFSEYVVHQTPAIPLSVVAGVSCVVYWWSGRLMEDDNAVPLLVPRTREPRPPDSHLEVCSQGCLFC